MYQIKQFISLLLLLFVMTGTFDALAQEPVAADSIESLEFTPINPETEIEKGEGQGDELTFSPLEEGQETATPKEKTDSLSKAPQLSSGNSENRSLFAVFIAGLLGGFAAFLMPCIFPMLPLTISYFSKKSATKRGTLLRSGFYGASIIFIYVVLGLLVTLLFGPDALNSLSTNGIFNFLFFLMLLVFAASFLGAFEITLPSSWVNKMDAKSEKSGFGGIFFMAATLALVSFSCTGPIIGTLLVEAATTKTLMAPAAGMFGFALALSIPFVLFSVFPSWMSALPRSGGWLNTVKVTLGFLELALALKFLSNVDLAYHWQWFDREVFLALWIIIFALMGFYLLGKLRFAHDSPVDGGISVPRLAASIIVLAFTVYMIPGLWGSPLKSISAFLPPQSTQDFDLYTNSISGGATPAGVNAKDKKYGDIFHAPLNLDAYFDYQEGMEYAQKVNKPVLIDFTGHACVNCRKMEANVWSEKEVLKRLKEDYVLIQLYVDDKTELPETEHQPSEFTGKIVTTIGQKWSDFQAGKFKANSQPYYVLLDHDGKMLTEAQGADYDPAVFAKFLDTGKERFRSL